MGKVVCIFCGKRRQRGKEHIFPRWLQNFMAGSTGKTFRGHHVASIPLNRPISTRVQVGQSLVFGGVCRKCNQGWMNELELSAAPYLKDVIASGAAACSWERVACEVVAKWAFKTSAMINAGTNYRRIIPPQHYHSFYEEGSLPEGVLVDIGITEGPEDHLEWSQGQNFVLSVPTGTGGPKHTDAARRSYKVTLAMGKVLLRVMFWSDTSCELPILPEGRAARIWPRNADLIFNMGPEDEGIIGFDAAALVVYPD